MKLTTLKNYHKQGNSEVETCYFLPRSKIFLRSALSLSLSFLLRFRNKELNNIQLSLEKATNKTAYVVTSVFVYCYVLWAVLRMIKLLQLTSFSQFDLENSVLLIGNFLIFVIFTLGLLAYHFQLISHKVHRFIDGGVKLTVLLLAIFSMIGMSKYDATFRDPLIAGLALGLTICSFLIYFKGFLTTLVYGSIIFIFLVGRNFMVDGADKYWMIMYLGCCYMLFFTLLYSFERTLKTIIVDQYQLMKIIEP